MNITKWAFGTAPLKKETHLKNIGAIENVSKFLDNLDVPTDGLLMSISLSLIHIFSEQASSIWHSMGCPLLTFGAVQTK